MIQNPCHEMITDSHHESVRIDTRNCIYLPCQDWMIFNFFVYGSLLYSQEEKKRNIPTIPLDRWITTKGYQLSRVSKSWNKIKWTSYLVQRKASWGSMTLFSLYSPNALLLFHFSNIPHSHQPQGLCTCCYPYGENVFFTHLPPTFSQHTSSSPCISDQSTAQNHFSWISSIYCESTNLRCNVLFAFKFQNECLLSFWTGFAHHCILQHHV